MIRLPANIHFYKIVHKSLHWFTGCWHSVGLKSFIRKNKNCRRGASIDLYAKECCYCNKVVPYELGKVRR